MTHPAEKLPSGFKRSLLKEAYALTKERYWKLTWWLTLATLPQIVIFLLAIGVGVVAAVNGAEIDSEKTETPFSLFVDGISLLAGVASLPLIGGLYWAILHLVRGEEGSARDLWTQCRKFWDYLFGYILFSLGILGGFLLLIVPGIVWSLKWSFYPFAICDENCGPLAALKRSGDLTRGAKRQLFLFFFLLVCLNILGTLAFVIGLAFTLPMSCVALVLFYEKLKVRHALLVQHLTSA